MQATDNRLTELEMLMLEQDERLRGMLQPEKPEVQALARAIKDMVLREVHAARETPVFVTAVGNRRPSPTRDDDIRTINGGDLLDQNLSTEPAAPDAHSPIDLEPAATLPVQDDLGTTLFWLTANEPEPRRDVPQPDDDVDPDASLPRDAERTPGDPPSNDSDGGDDQPPGGDPENGNPGNGDPGGDDPGDDDPEDDPSENESGDSDSDDGDETPGRLPMPTDKRKQRETLTGYGVWDYDAQVPFVQWQKVYDRAFRVEGWPEAEKLNLVYAYLTGTALELYYRLRPDEKKSWEDFVNAMKTANHETVIDEYTARQLFNDITQGKDQTLDQLSLEIRELARLAFPDVSDRRLDLAMREQFVSAIWLSQTKNTLIPLEREVESFKALVEKAVFCDARFRKERKIPCPTGIRPAVHPVAAPTPVHAIQTSPADEATIPDLGQQPLTDDRLIEMVTTAVQTFLTQSLSLPATPTGYWDHADVDAQQHGYHDKLANANRPRPPRARTRGKRRPRRTPRSDGPSSLTPHRSLPMHDADGWTTTGCTMSNFIAPRTANNAGAPPRDGFRSAADVPGRRCYELPTHRPCRRLQRPTDSRHVARGRA